MYLIDTNVISEVRKGRKTNTGVRAFFDQVLENNHDVYLSVVTIGELRRGIESIRYRGDIAQAKRLGSWLDTILIEYAEYILDIGQDISQVWGKLRVPHHENAIDKMIAATALIHGLIVVTRNVEDFKQTGVDLLDPFTQM
jgi:toxin FitB